MIDTKVLLAIVVLLFFAAWWKRRNGTCSRFGPIVKTRPAARSNRSEPYPRVVVDLNKPRAGAGAQVVFDSPAGGARAGAGAGTAPRPTMPNGSLPDMSGVKPGVAPKPKFVFDLPAKPPQGADPMKQESGGGMFGGGNGGGGGSNALLGLMTVTSLAGAASSIAGTAQNAQANAAQAPIIQGQKDRIEFENRAMGVYAKDQGGDCTGSSYEQCKSGCCISGKCAPYEACFGNAPPP